MSGPDRTSLARLVAEPGPSLTRAIVRLLRPGMRAISHHDWSGLDHVPKTGGVIIAPNHVSNFDPLVISHVLVHAGRWPYFLAKSSLFAVPVLRTILQRAEQIPVQRGTAAAAEALVDAAAALRAGRTVIIYPEGTITADPKGWPMTGRGGAVRLALETGVPLIPVGQWGAQAILGGKRIRPPRLIPRPMIKVAFGPPVPLADLVSPTDPAPSDRAVTIGTERLMTAITALVAELRGEPAPPTVFDYAAWRRSQRSGTARS